MVSSSNKSSSLDAVFDSQFDDGFTSWPATAAPVNDGTRPIVSTAAAPAADVSKAIDACLSELSNTASLSSSGHLTQDLNKQQHDASLASNLLPTDAQVRQQFIVSSQFTEA